MDKSLTNYYIYWISKQGEIFYERTTGTKEHAIARCKELRKREKVADALYTVNRVIKGAFV